ncbi:MAG: IS200/IS605 family transposase [Verrucomicrobia bacterium]|nr:IS200/IS605 family transposase [Verrucomicrobiota bacterium]
MAHSYSSMLFHLVWSTKERCPLILPEIKNRLYGYIRQIANDEDSKIIAMNGMPDHIHILLGIKPSMNLSDLIRQIKTTSSKWVQKTFPEKGKFGWQDGYGAFSVGMSTVQAVKRYIQNQEEHHLKQPFQEEFIGFLDAHGISYDPRFVLE